MRTTVVMTVAIAVLSGSLLAQENKPVPKNSVRVSVPGCTRGYIFTVGSRSANEAGSNFEIPKGMHLRMNGPRKMMAEIKAHEGSMIQITGLMKKGQFRTDGVGIGGGVRIGAGPADGRLGMGGGQTYIDVEGWHPIDGSCPSR
ncbi:MAG: hypothetical protein ACM3SQ_02975 [Betaproteobacteria bacterium]